MQVRRFLVLFSVLAVAAWCLAGAASGVVGFQGPSTSGTGSEPSGSKPESKLWWNDGFWWGSFWDTASSRFEIWKLNASTQTWASTNVPIDTRSGSRADALWHAVSGKLYVASHVFTESPASGVPSYLYRYSYNAGTDVYSLDVGFPAQINNLSLETLVIDRDSTGQLWATWVQAGKVWVNRTLCSPSCADASWGTAFVLPVSGAANVKSDDISSVIAFGGSRVGVMWSNQNAKAMYFSTHGDADADTTWRATETAYFSSNMSLADDHINLKMQAGAGGRVFAATKTSNSTAGQPLTALLVRDPASGAWSSSTFGTVSDGHTRPIVLLDEQHGVVHMFATSKSGDIVTKTASITAPSFPAGVGTTVIDQSSGINNATSTKQKVNSTTGLVVVATGGGRYWHHWNPLGSTTPTGTATVTDDAYVRSDLPTSTSGDAASLRVRHLSSLTIRSYLKITISGLSGPAKATLRLYVADATPGTISAWPVADTSWSEATLTWSNRPPLGSAIATTPAASLGSWVELNLGSIPGNGTFSFALTNDNGDVALFDSTEATNKPHIILTP